MPTRPTKGNHGLADRGSRESGNQKAVDGSAMDPEVIDLQSEAAVGDGPWQEERAEQRSES